MLAQISCQWFNTLEWVQTLNLRSDVMTSEVIVKLKGSDEAIGFIFSEHLIPTNKGGVIDMIPKIGVCWADERSPAITYHDPSDLEWIDAGTGAIEAYFGEGDDEEDDEEDAESVKPQVKKETTRPQLEV